MSVGATLQLAGKLRKRGWIIRSPARAFAVRVFGVDLTISEVAHILGLSSSAVHQRKKMGRPIMAPRRRAGTSRSS